MPLTPLEGGGGKGFSPFGDGSDGDLTVTTAVELTSVEDGDVVVREYTSLDIQSGGSLTVSDRCRGLVIFVDGTLNVDGTLTMTGKGCHANPAESTTSTDTPVAPSDGNAVPSEGIVFRFPKSGGSDSHSATDIGNGLGTALREILQQFPAVTNGYIINIPRVGGAGAAYGTYEDPGVAGGTLTDAPGGGGSGAVNSTRGGAGGDATCFSGGAGGGGAYTSTTTDADDYGGAGSPGSRYGAAAGGGAGNPGGAGAGSDSYAGGDGTGGLLIIIAREITGAGTISAEGTVGGYSGPGMAGGSSGGGVIGIVYSTAYTFSGTLSAAGGVAAVGYAQYYGGAGGAGSVIGPEQIDE